MRHAHQNAEMGRGRPVVPKRRLGPGLLVGLLLSAPQAVFAQTVALEALETEELLLLNASSNTPELAPHAARSFLNSLDFHKKLFNWNPADGVTVVLMDSSDAGSASAGVAPRELVASQVSPPDKSFEHFLPIDPMFVIMNHEVAHLATCDAHGEAEIVWRKIFAGKVKPIAEHPETVIFSYLTVPRDASPRWQQEGIASFMDTWMSGGIGRAQGGFDEMVFRAMVRDNTPFYSNLGLASEGTKVDFNTGTNAYLYGTRFMSYLAYQYSPEKLIEWFRRDAGSERYYADQFESVFGEPLEDVWQDWIAFEQEFQAENLASVRQFTPTVGQRLSKQPVGWVSRMFVDERSNGLVGGLMYPGVVAHLGVISLSEGTETNLYDIKGPAKYSVTSTAWDSEARRLFFVEDDGRKRDLRYLDLETGRVTPLLENARIGSLVFNRKDKSLWGVKHEGGKVTLVGMLPPYEEVIELFQAPYGQAISDMDISPDGRYLSATVGDIQGHQYLQVFRVSDLVDGTFEAAAQFDFGRAFPEGFVFSPDGKYLFGSAYYTGVSNIYRFELATGDMQAVTNAETGFFRPIPQADGSLIVFEYTGAGFIPIRLQNTEPLESLGTIDFLGNELVKRHPVLATWGAGDPSEVDLESQVKSRADYIPWRRLQHESSYPMLEGYKEKAALGYSFNWSDPVQLNTFKLDLSYSADAAIESSERLHVDAEYTYMDWGFRYWHNDANFYDLFGPTERSRKGDAFIVSYDHALVYDPPRQLDFSADIAYYTGLDTLPANQSAQAEIDELWSGSFGWEYTHKNKSQGAAVDEKGLRWELRSDVDYAESELYPKVHGALELGFALPLKHASLWIYNAAGAGSGDRDEVLSSVYFGGFGNNYVDNGSVKRYRDYDSMPGFEIGEIAAKRFAKTLVEFNTPPIRFAEVGTPAFYLGEIQPSIFAGTLLTEPGSAREERYSNVGVQLDLTFTALHRLPMTVSVGYARGFAGGGDDTGEFMLSLKVL